MFFGLVKYFLVLFNIIEYFKVSFSTIAILTSYHVNLIKLKHP